MTTKKFERVDAPESADHVKTAYVYRGWLVARDDHDQWRIAPTLDLSADGAIQWSGYDRSGDASTERQLHTFKSRKSAAAYVDDQITNGADEIDDDGDDHGCDYCETDECACGEHVCECECDAPESEPTAAPDASELDDFDLGVERVADDADATNGADQLAESLDALAASGDGADSGDPVAESAPFGDAPQLVERLYATGDEDRPYVWRIAESLDAAESETWIDRDGEPLAFETGGKAKDWIERLIGTLPPLADSAPRPWIVGWSETAAAAPESETTETDATGDDAPPEIIAYAATDDARPVDSAACLLALSLRDSATEIAETGETVSDGETLIDRVRPLIEHVYAADAFDVRAVAAVIHAAGAETVIGDLPRYTLETARAAERYAVAAEHDSIRARETANAEYMIARDALAAASESRRTRNKTLSESARAGKRAVRDAGAALAELTETTGAERYGDATDDLRVMAAAAVRYDVARRAALDAAADGAASVGAIVAGQSSAFAMSDPMVDAAPIIAYAVARDALERADGDGETVADLLAAGRSAVAQLATDPESDAPSAFTVVVRSETVSDGDGDGGEFDASVVAVLARTLDGERTLWLALYPTAELAEIAAELVSLDTVADAERTVSDLRDTFETARATARAAGERERDARRVLRLAERAARRADDLTGDGDDPDGDDDGGAASSAPPDAPETGDADGDGAIDDPEIADLVDRLVAEVDAHEIDDPEFADDLPSRDVNADADDAAPRVTPQVAPLAGMTPLGMTPPESAPTADPVAVAFGAPVAAAIAAPSLF